MGLCKFEHKERIFTCVDCHLQQDYEDDIDRVIEVVREIQKDLKGVMI